MDEKIEEIKKRLSALENSLSENEKGMARAELDSLVSDLNADIEEYLARMKALQIKQ